MGARRLLGEKPTQQRSVIYADMRQCSYARPKWPEHWPPATKESFIVIVVILAVQQEEGRKVQYN